MGEYKFNITDLQWKPLGAVDCIEEMHRDGSWKESYMVDKIRYLEREVDRLRDKLREKKIDLPEKYIINEDATILFWKKKEKTIVKRSDDDEFNARLGFLTAFFQHYSGMSRSKANKFLANLKVERK